MRRYVLIESDFVPEEEAKVSVLSHTFNYGTSVFEGVRGYWDKSTKQMYIFRLIEHLERLNRSARLLRIQLPGDTETLVGYCKELVRRNGYQQDIYIRPIAYKGVPCRLGVTLTDAPDHFLIYSMPIEKYLATERPLRVCVSSWQRIPDNAAPARGKIGGTYINAALAKTDAIEQGFDECIMLTREGTVAEGSTENLFLVKDGSLITPSTTEDILVGITRDTVIHAAECDLGLTVKERVVDRSEIYEADECFFCGTAAEIAGIGEVDGRKIGEGKIGPITKTLMNLFSQIVRARLERYRDWCIPVYEE